MREIILDTETTGLNARAGHRIIEIGLIEIEDKDPTGRVFHTYLNPGRPVEQEAFGVHGISTEFLVRSHRPTFKRVAPEMVAFIGDSPMVIHNASFDLGFINAELKYADMECYSSTQTVDTLKLARKAFPKQKNTLDALCARLKIDASIRDHGHGALIDCQLLCAVYMHLTGGRQRSIEFGGTPWDNEREAAEDYAAQSRAYREPRPHSATPDEKSAHAAFLANNVKNPLWMHE